LWHPYRLTREEEMGINVRYVARHVQGNAQLIRVRRVWNMARYLG
jgi:hypothetical protein